MRPARAWRGRFLDAHGTWFDRLAAARPPALGTAVTARRRRAAGARGDADAAWPSAEAAGYQFRGYRLDGAGVPTFLYRFGTCDVEDRLEPGSEGTLRRRAASGCGTGNLTPPCGSGPTPAASCDARKHFVH